MDFNIGDLIWYMSWAENEYTVEVVDVNEEYVTCKHTNPEHIGKGFTWYFRTTRITGSSSGNLLDWVSSGKAIHHPISREPDWEI